MDAYCTSMSVTSRLQLESFVRSSFAGTAASLLYRFSPRLSCSIADISVHLFRARAMQTEITSSSLTRT